MDTNNQQPTENSFDPATLGAKPVQDAFDPTSIGAKSYDPATTDINKSAALLGLSTAAHEKLQNINPVDPSTVNNPDKIAPYVQKAQDAQTNANQAASEATIGSAIKSGVKDFANGTIRAVGSALRSPVDIIRGMFGMAPTNEPIGQFGGGTVPSVQAQAATDTGKVFDQQMSPMEATGNAVGGALETANVLGVDDAVKGVKTLAEKAAGTDTGKALISGAKDFISSKADSSASKKAMDIVSPRLNADVAANAQTKTSLLRGKTTIVPEQHTEDMANAVKDIVKGNSYSEDKELVKTALNKEAESLKAQIKTVDHPVPKQELISTLTKAERPVLIASDTTMNNAYNKVLSKVSDIVSNSDGTVSGILDARKGFDSFVEKQFPNLYKSDAMTPMRTAIKDIRSKMNDFIVEQLPKADPEGSLSSFHPDDQKFLTDYAQKVANDEPVSNALTNRAKQTLESYGKHSPSISKDLADFINTAKDSADQNTLNAQMDSKLRGNDFKASLKKQSLMYDAIDNISEKAAKGAPKVQGEIGTTRIDRFAEKHPTTTKTIKGGAYVLGGGAAAEGGKKILTGQF